MRPWIIRGSWLVPVSHRPASLSKVAEALVARGIQAELRSGELFFRIRRWHHRSGVQSWTRAVDSGHVTVDAEGGFVHYQLSFGRLAVFISGVLFLACAFILDETTQFRITFFLLTLATFFFGSRISGSIGFRGVLADVLSEAGRES